MPLQLSQSHNDPYFTIYPLAYSFSTSSELHMSIPSSISLSIIISPPYLKSSAGKLSIPDALLFSNALIASLCSSRVISSRMMLKLLPSMAFSIVK